MSGVLITGALLHADAPLLATVPAEWIVAWTLPQGAPANAIVVTRISRTEDQMLAPEPLRRVNERVQVTIRAADGEMRATIERLARSACADRVGTIAGFEKVSVLLAGGGPDFMDDPASIFLTSFDLRVSFLELA
jgi:hypothetical protein